MAHYYDSQLQRPTTFNFATDVVDYWAQNPPHTSGSVGGGGSEKEEEQKEESYAMHWLSQDRQTSRKLSFAHFSRQSHRLAVLFRHHLHIFPGDKMLIIMPRLPEWWEIATAGLRSGIVVCPATTLLVEQDIAYRVQRSGAKVFIGDAVAVKKFLRVRGKCGSVKVVLQVDGRGGGGGGSGTTREGLEEEEEGGVVLLHEVLKKVPADAMYTGPKPGITDPSMIYFTSGTTGPPKMVQHNQISYPLAHTITGKHFHRLRPGFLNWVLTEQGWAKAGWAWLGTWNCGAGLFIHDDRQPFNPQATLEILHTFPITTFCAPPTVYRQLVLDENRRLMRQRKPKALQHCTGAGEPLNPEVIRLWLEMTGLEICDGFGQSETILLCGNFAGNAIRPGSMGKPSPGTPLFVINDDGKIAGDGEEGDIAVRVDLSGKSDFFGVFDGYLDENGVLGRRLREVRRDDNNNDKAVAWYSTGDRATRDKDGYFWFVGRNDDVINSAGYRIGPFEVESVLKQHPAVVESAVVASPDASRGEVVKAFVVLTEEYRAKDQDRLVRELQDYCKRNAAPYKYPRKVQFVDA